MIRTRFAPSPTGDLHLGGALVALASYWLARKNGGKLVLRVEDLDPPRVVAGSADRIMDDLRWLGLTWDEGPYFQSQRSAQYAEAVVRLEAAGHVYRCDCSRSEIANVASAPHGEEILYPRTCRDKPASRSFRRPPALRFRSPKDDVDDFVLQRFDGVFSYHLAVSVDDLAMNITDVVRGADLATSTPRHVLLMELLGARSSPRYLHLPLVVGADGARLSKRTPGAHVPELRARGISAAHVLGVLGHALGLCADGPASLDDLVAAPELCPQTASLRTPFP